MGILNDGINEVIATTRINAAPMGIIGRGGRFRMVCFLGSHTERNIARDRWVVANIVHDPVLYVQSAFTALPAGAFCEENVNGIPMTRLIDAEAWVAFSVIVGKRGTDSMTVRLVPVCEKVVVCKPHPVNRGFCAIIEAAVHGTRYRISQDPALKDQIDSLRAIVRKCGGLREQEALTLLDTFIS